MRRAAEAGVATIEHGYGGDPEVFRVDGPARSCTLPDADCNRGLGNKIPRLAESASIPNRSHLLRYGFCFKQAREGGRDHRQW